MLLKEKSIYNLSFIFIFTILIFVFSFQFSSMFYLIAWNYYFRDNFRFCFLRNQTLQDFIFFSLWYHSFSFPHVFIWIFLFKKIFFFAFPTSSFSFCQAPPIESDKPKWLDRYVWRHVSPPTMHCHTIIYFRSGFVCSKPVKDWKQNIIKLKLSLIFSCLLKIKQLIVKY